MIDELRINAAIAELQQQNLALTQRCINFAGDIAMLNAKLDAASAKPVKKTRVKKPPIVVKPAA